MSADPSLTTSSMPTTLNDWLGPSLLVDKKTTKKTQDVMNDKKLLLLYFSASWCPPCQAFTPRLRDFYRATQSELEIVYVSSDKSLKEFESYYEKMPWAALGTDDGAAAVKNRIAQALQIRGIPVLVVLRKADKEEKKDGSDSATASTWLFVTRDARNQVAASASASSSGSTSSSSPKSIVDEWHTADAVPVSEVSFSSERQSIREIIIALVKSPLFVFGMAYLIKYLLKTYVSKSHSTGDNATITASLLDESPVVALDGDYEEPEF